jgi:multimeric flavodoxin WrbA
MGSPIYFWGLSGVMKSFMERLMFPFYRYTADDDPARSLFPGKIHTGFIYTMNSVEGRLKQVGYDSQISVTEFFLERVFGMTESLACVDTCQFDDFSKIDQNRFDPAKKAAARKERFPLDCQKAFEMGARFAARA